MLPELRTTGLVHLLSPFPPVSCLFQCVRITVHLFGPAPREVVRVNLDEKRSVRVVVVVPIVQKVGRTGRVENPLGDVHLEFRMPRRNLSPSIIVHAMAPFENRCHQRIETRECTPIRSNALFIGCATESILILLEKAQTVCRNMLYLWEAHVRSLWSF